MKTGVGSLQRRPSHRREGPTPMPHRVSPTERIHGHIDELFASGRQLPEILEEVARLGAQLLMQAALEAEITEFLGRDRYQRAAACQDARPCAARILDWMADRRFHLRPGVSDGWL